MSGRSDVIVTKFRCAVMSKQIEIICSFLDAGVDVNVRADDGSTALHWAAQSGHEGVVELLCERGANVNARQKNGWAPLHVAAFENCAEVVKALLKAGADIDAQGSRDETPLHCTNFFADEVVATLLDNGCDVNAVTSRGATALDVFVVCTKRHFRNLDEEKLHEYLDKFDSDDFDPHRKPCFPNPDDFTAGIVKKHLLKLENAGLDISQRNSDLIHRHQDLSCTNFQYFEELCREEVKQMKSVKLSSQLTLYDTLVNRKNPTFARNKSLMRILYTLNLDSFPIYKSLVANCLKRSDRRLRLLEAGEKGLVALAEKSRTFSCTQSGKGCLRCLKNGVKCGLPALVTEQIVVYLSDNDLKKLTSFSTAQSNSASPDICISESVPRKIRRID